jgi:hypothetical protein
MMTIQSYPEHHHEWLAAMGVVRWQARDSRLISAPTTPIVHVEAVAEVTREPDFVWPERMVQARYWLVGESALDAATAYLLAGMMKAIGATQDEVVYTSIVDDAQERYTTGLPSWPVLNVQALPRSVFEQPLKVADELIVLTLGAVDHQWETANPVKLPGLTEMIARPELKKEAWMLLKQL